MKQTLRMYIGILVVALLFTSCIEQTENYKAKISSSNIKKVQLSSEMIYDLAKVDEAKVKDLLVGAEWKPFDESLHTEDYIIFDSGLVVGILEAGNDTASIVVDEKKYKLSNLDTNIYSLLDLKLDDVLDRSTAVFVGHSTYWDTGEDVLLVDALEMLSGSLDDVSDIDVASYVNLSSDKGDKYVFFVAPSDDDRFSYKMLLYIEIDDKGFLKFGRTLDVQSFDLKGNTVENLKDYIDQHKR